MTSSTGIGILSRQSDVRSQVGLALRITSKGYVYSNKVRRKHLLWLEYPYGTAPPRRVP